MLLPDFPKFLPNPLPLQDFGGNKGEKMVCGLSIWSKKSGGGLLCLVSSSLSRSAMSEEPAYTAKQDLCLVNELCPWKCPECF